VTSAAIVKIVLAFGLAASVLGALFSPSAPTRPEDFELYRYGSAPWQMQRDGLR